MYEINFQKKKERKRETIRKDRYPETFLSQIFHPYSTLYSMRENISFYQ